MIAGQFVLGGVRAIVERQLRARSCHRRTAAHRRNSVGCPRLLPSTPRTKEMRGPIPTCAETTAGASSTAAAVTTRPSARAFIRRLRLCEISGEGVKNCRPRTRADADAPRRERPAARSGGHRVQHRAHSIGTRQRPLPEQQRPVFSFRGPRVRRGRGHSGEPSEPAPTASADAYASTLMTTRRFWARPSRVLFGAAGLSSP